MARSVGAPLLQRIGDFVRAVGPAGLSVRSLSFSQYGEDRVLAVSLWPQTRGVYVDVGAYHPWRDSNTYKLYLKGWRGLTIEPNPEYARLFRRYRPRDTHLTVGVGRDPGHFEYFEFKDRKLNTFSPEVARIRESQGGQVLNRRRLSCEPLQALVDAHLKADGIDLLSVDCEGHDLDVLRSLDFSRTRPTAILVEDFAAFEGLGTGRSRSETAEFLSAVEYRAIGQFMFTTLYVDADAIGTGRSTAFDLANCQVYRPKEEEEAAEPAIRRKQETPRPVGDLAR